MKKLDNFRWTHTQVQSWNS